MVAKFFGLQKPSKINRKKTTLYIEALEDRAVPAAPIVSVDSVSVIGNEGSQITQTGTYSDPDGDIVVLTVPPSLGTISKTGISSGTWSWSYTPGDGPDDSTTITVTATDSNNGTGTVSFGLTVNNVAPSVTVANATVNANEGTPVTNSGTFSDPGIDVVTITASVGTVSQGNGTWNWSYTPPDGPATQTVTITATDSDGAVATTAFNLIISNLPPTVAATNATVIAGEGLPATNSGTFADPGFDTVTITASVGTITQGTGTWTWSFTPPDGPATQTVTITATDSDGAVATTSFNLVTTNTAPTVVATSATVTVNEGSPAANSGTFADPGIDTVTLTASIGTITQGAGTWTWSFTPADGPASQTVTITATDSDGAVGTTTFNLVVLNVAPTVTAANASVTVNEGSLATNNGTFADVGVDTVTITASVGTISQGAGTWNWSYTPPDGPATQTVTITATDSDGAVATTTFNLTVNNVPPSVTRANATVTVGEGSLATNSGTFSDPGDDTVTLTASVGTITQGAGTWNWSDTPPDGPATQTVTITATDSDGAVGTTTFNLNVNNVAPSVTVANTVVTVGEGSPATNSGTFSDPGDDTVTLSASVGTITQGAGTWTWSHTIADGPAGQTVTITATDSDGAVGTVTFSLVVNNLPPVIAVDNPVVNATEGSPAANSGTFFDPGVDTVTITASVGTITQGAGTWTWSYTPPDGPLNQTVTIFGTDSDGTVGSATFSLVVANAPPTVTVANATVTVDEGSPTTNNGTFADVGVDTVTITASVGTITQGAGTWTWNFTPANGPLTQTVTITATDSDGAVGTTTFDLQVLNVAPELTIASDVVTVNEGSQATNSGTFTDPGSETVVITASIGTVTQNNGTWSWSYTPPDGPAGPTEVVIFANDDDEETTITFDLVVENVAPTVGAAQPSVTVNEFTTATNSGTFGDVGDDIVDINASVGTITQGAGTGSGVSTRGTGRTSKPSPSPRPTATARRRPSISNWSCSIPPPP